MNTMEHDFIEGNAGNCRNCKACKCHSLPVVVIVLLVWILAALIYMIMTLPSIVRSEVQREPALKAGGVANYERILNEVYDTPEYQKMMTDQLESALVQNKAMMEMYSQQQASGSTSENPTEETGAVSWAVEAPAVEQTGATN